MIEIGRLSTRFAVRRMGDADADAILRLCRGNVQYYRYCGAEATREQILNDLHITPPGTALSAKYYLGFYEREALVAVMDLIDGYPEQDLAFIGFFMLDIACQGRLIGSSIIGEAAACLKAAGKSAVMLGIDKDNPQSTHFWKKNGFRVLRELDRDGWTVLVAEKRL